LSFKIGANSSLWRMQTIAASGRINVSSHDSIENNQKGSNFSIAFGKEYRKILTEKLELRSGVDLKFGYSSSVTNRNDSRFDGNDYETMHVSYSPGLNLVFGFNYLVSSNIVLGVELNPYVKYNSSEYTNLDNNEIITSK